MDQETEVIEEKQFTTNELVKHLIDAPEIAAETTAEVRLIEGQDKWLGYNIAILRRNNTFILIPTDPDQRVCALTPEEFKQEYEDRKWLLYVKTK